MTEVTSCLVLSIACIVAAGCAQNPTKQETTAMPIAPVSTAIGPSSFPAPNPQHPLVEFIWHIAATDDLRDPQHLFVETLGVKNFSGVATYPTHIRANTKAMATWPAGLEDASYMRVDAKDPQTPGHRDLDFTIDTTLACVRFDDLFATFGKDYWLPPAPIIAPYPSSAPPGNPPKKDHNISSMVFKSPYLFQGDPEGFIRFRFDYHHCANAVFLRIPLNPFVFQYFKREIKK